MQNQISDPHKKVDNIEFLPAALEILEKPPAPFGRIIAATISVFFLFLVVWAWWGTVDIVVVAEGQTFPTGKVKTVQPLETGVVRAIHIQDGQRVKAGELLIELDPTETDANLESLAVDLTHARVNAAIGEAMLMADPVAVFVLPEGTPATFAANSQILLADSWERLQASLQSIKAEKERMRASLRATSIDETRIDKSLPLLKERLDGLSGLLDKGLAEKPLVLELKREVVDMEAQRETLVESRAQALASLSALDARETEAIAAYRSSAADRRQEALNKIASIEQSLRKEEQRQSYQNLRAPVDGFVDKLTIHTIGAVVETGSPLLSIVPTETPLEIEAIVLNKDIGFVAPGQVAEIKLEAFPFTRYGVLHGKVKSLSNDVIIDERMGPIYKAKVKIDRQSILIEGKEIALTPGMRATAEVKTGKRRIIDFFLSPLLRYKDEAIRER